MNYTIKIAENYEDSGKILRMVKELAGDSPLVAIYEEETGISHEMEKELEQRYLHVLKNPDEWKSWDDVRNDLLIR